MVPVPPVQHHHRNTAICDRMRFNSINRSVNWNALKSADAATTSLSQAQNRKPALTSLPRALPNRSVLTRIHGRSACSGRTGNPQIYGRQRS